jgi:hypothetical protein
MLNAVEPETLKRRISANTFILNYFCPRCIDDLQRRALGTLKKSWGIRRKTAPTMQRGNYEN